MKCLFCLFAVNFSCNGKVLEDEKQVTAALKPPLFLPRTPFPKLQPASNHLITTLQEAQSGTSAVKSSQETPLAVSQLTHSMPEAKINPAEPTRSVNQTAVRLQVKATISPTVTPANLAHPTHQAAIHTVVKITTMTERAAVRSEGRADQTGTHRVVNVAATTLKPGRPNGRKTTFPIQPASAENENVSETTEKHPVHLSQQVTLKRANNATHKNMSAVTAALLLPTAPTGPTLTPKPSLAATGAYHVSNGTADCIKALIGLTMIVKNRNTSNVEYFNIDPNTTTSTGICGIQLSTLNISFHSGYVRFTFTKVSISTKLNHNFVYLYTSGIQFSGIKTGQFFSAPVGNCFKCFSKQTVDLANNFQLAAVNSQLQAFDIVDNKFGKALCSSQKLLMAPFSKGSSYPSELLLHR
uniref:Lysosomal associated membrane protein 3 n=1 Tax=Varanus komodoensis TaxID=61221 RepID=A0A8D2L8G8_VARKO